MTSREFSEVDHDLLADYVGGALDGTPERATVARLVEEDPAWGDAYAALARAMDLVRADLAAWATGPAPEMPLAVADRITAALAGAGPVPVDDDAPVEPTAGEGHASGDLRRTGWTPPAQPAGPAGPRAGGANRPGRSTGPGRRSRRWVRIAGPVALAAASVTAVGFGASSLIGAGRSDSSVAADSLPAAGRGQEGAPAPLGTAPVRTTGPVLHSGTDYGPEQLPGIPHALFADPDGGRETTGPSAAQRLSAAAGLDRLNRPEALESCLRSISAEHAGGPLTVDLVDYASFQGSPALVVTFLDGTGERWAWVSGPECGVPGSEADTRFRTRVG
ncbi:hypothetical protein [Micromonospora eburnea]|uniref:Uncharacterized protein n=1 Tax=Micromonospora eburnea TaxID=227316 RepID=A0A1C6VPU0_9ACTN|nr:hypothetical protein [Micromonospora eburnea]SCL68329.1 hypothetical protein GA0070604_6266 [Micromonospora eburnea]